MVWGEAGGYGRGLGRGWTGLGSMWSKDGREGEGARWGRVEARRAGRARQRALLKGMELTVLIGPR